MLSLSERRNNEYKIELLKAIKSLPFPRIKDLVSAKGIPADLTFLDYAALNCSLEHGRKDVANFLLEHKCRVNKVSRLLTKPSNTPLHYAIKLGDLEMVQKLLKKNASMTAVNSQGNSPLHLAFVLREDRITDVILDFILETATFANPANNHGLTHLHIAITRKNANLVLSYMKITSNLLDEVNKDSPYYPGYTVMQFAIESKSPLILKLLLEQGGNYLTRQSKDTLALLQKDFEDISLMTYLLSSYTQTKSQSNLSELHIACMRNNPTLVSNFLEYGAVVNNAISENAAFCPLYTPLHYATETNCKESVRLLLQHGGDADFQDANYMTALHLAIYNDQQEIAEMLWAATKNKLADGCDRNGLGYFHIAIVRNDIEVVKKFLDKRQDVNARVFQNLRNFSNYTPLHFAVRYGHVGIVKLLIGNGANVHASDVNQHGTPLQMAFAAGHRGLIEFFLKVDPRVDLRRPNDNKTLLHLLVEAYMDDGKRSMLLIVEKLVEKLVIAYRLDVNAKDSDGYTALHYACTKISVGADCAKVLLKYGADINIENNVGDTPFEVSFYDMYRNNADDYMVLYNHVKGLKTLGVAVNSKNDECCERLLREKDECQPNAECFRPKSLVKKTQEAVNEILKMKELMLSKDVSVYQFLLMSEGSLKKFEGNLETLKALVEGEMIKEFKYFGYRVMIQWMKLLMVRAAGAVAAF